MKKFLQYGWLFILFCVLQTLIFERIQLGPFLYPCIYLLFILLFPFGYNTLWLLLWSFAMGLSIDLFSVGALGMHASAATCLGLLRINILKVVATKGDVAQLAIPTPRTLGFPWYLAYVALSLFVHHAILFGWENFHFNYLFYTIVRILCSTFLNTILILLIQSTFFNQGRVSE